MSGADGSRRDPLQNPGLTATKTTATMPLCTRTATMPLRTRTALHGVTLWRLWFLRAAARVDDLRVIPSLLPCTVSPGRAAIVYNGGHVAALEMLQAFPDSPPLVMAAMRLLNVLSHGADERAAVLKAGGLDAVLEALERNRGGGLLASILATIQQARRPATNRTFSLL